MKIVVGLSGGVDSAVAALLAKRAGHDVVGLFMKNWEDDDDDEYCSTREDLIDAVSAAERIGIEIEAVNFSAEYRDRGSIVLDTGSVPFDVNSIAITADGTVYALSGIKENGNTRYDLICFNPGATETPMSYSSLTD